MRFFAVIFSLLVLGSASANAEVPGLVRVIAKVVDEGTLKETVREGTGTIVQKSGRFFVLTAAHVSLGRAPTLMSGGEFLSIKGRYVDAAADVDWMEIEAPRIAKPLIFWADRYKSFMLDKHVEPWDTRDLVVADCRWVSPLTKDSSPCDVGLYSPPSILPAEEKASAPLVHLSMSTKSALGIVSPYLEALTNRIILPVTMRKGQSGSPLFWKVRGNRSVPYWKLAGIAQSFDIFFPVSYYGVSFAPSFAKVSAQQYEGSFIKRPVWHLRFGLTYLDFGNGIKEIALARDNAGTGGITDDGGTGGITDDGGRGTKASDDVYSARRLQPGIEVDGKSCIGFHTPTDDVYFADRSVVESLVQGVLDRRNCVPTGFELHTLLLDRLSTFSARKVTAGMEMSQAGGAKIEIHENGIDVSLPVTSLENQRLGWLRFSLDKFGGYLGNPYRPVISVPGLRGAEKYVVDLRGLYFTVLGGGPAVTQSRVRVQPVFLQAMQAGRSKDPMLIQFLFSEPRSVQLRKSPPKEP